MNLIKRITEEYQEELRNFPGNRDTLFFIIENAANELELSEKSFQRLCDIMDKKLV